MSQHACTQSCICKWPSAHASSASWARLNTLWCVIQPSSSSALEGANKLPFCHPLHTHPSHASSSSCPLVPARYPLHAPPVPVNAWHTLMYHPVISLSFWKVPNQHPSDATGTLIRVVASNYPSYPCKKILCEHSHCQSMLDIFLLKTIIV
jgi:hypothetical protein